MSNKCKHCGETIHSWQDEHRCSVTGRTYSKDNDDGDFLLSAIIGYATDSALLGGLIGGDMTGGILGDVFNGGSLFDDNDSSSDSSSDDSSGGDW